MGAADRPTPDRDFGPYRLVHRIASGGMAEVFLAKIRGLGDFEKFVAIKTIHANLSEDPSFVQMLIDEAKISVQLQHGNIAQTFDLGRVGETYYITMEFVDGCDLFKLLRVASEKNEPTPLAVAAWVAKEFATGLDYAHRKRGENGEPLGIVHRDVSPQNVLLSHSGEVKIADFGIAKAAQRAVHTAVGTIKGKYYYMSPEQAWGDPVDHRTDVFSAGIVLHEMLCGQMLYLEDDLRRLLDMVRKAEIAPPSSRRRDVPPDLDRIVMRALARRPEARFQSAQELATALERWLHLHAPDYTPTRLCSFMRQILDPAAAAAPAPAAALRAPAVQVPAPRAPERPAPRAPAPRSSTASVSREAIARSRTEFDDENSVILDLAQVSRTRKPATARHGTPVRHVESATPYMPLQDEPERTVITASPYFGELLNTAHTAPDGYSDAEDDTQLSQSIGDATGAHELHASSPHRAPRANAARAPRQDVQRDARANIAEVAYGTDEHGISSGNDVGDRTVVGLAPAPVRTSRSNDAQTASSSLRVAPLVGGRDDGDGDDDEPTLSRRPDDVSGLALRPGHLAAQLEPKGRTTPARSSSSHASAPSAPSARSSSSPMHARPLGTPARAPAADPFEPTGAPDGHRTSTAPPSVGSGFAARLGQPAPQPTPPIARESVDQPWLSGGTAGLERISLAPPMRWPWLLAVVSVVAAVAAWYAGRADEAPRARRQVLLEIVSIPSGATVMIDGVRQPTLTPLENLTREPGEFRLRFELAGHEPVERVETLSSEARSVKLIAELRPIPYMLHVTSDPPGAEVLLDLQALGQTPLHAALVDPKPTGKVELRYVGRKPNVQTIEWRGRREITLDVRLLPAP